MGKTIKDISEVFTIKEFDEFKKFIESLNIKQPTFTEDEYQSVAIIISLILMAKGIPVPVPVIVKILKFGKNILIDKTKEQIINSE